jgi:integrase
MKDHEERELPLSEELFDLLMQLRQKHLTSKLVFGAKNGKPNTKLLQLVKRRARRAGLNCGNCDGCAARQECERWFLHRSRATYYTKLLRSGMDLRTVQQMMGHSDLASTMRYLRPAENTHVQEKVNQINWYKGSAVSPSAVPLQTAERI